MLRGIDVVMHAAHLAERIAGADFVFTGEGSIDSQTAGGKTPLGVAESAALHGVPVIAFAALVPIVQGVSDLEQALAHGPRNLEDAVATTCRLLALRIGRQA
jgi:glycerate kinase